MYEPTLKDILVRLDHMMRDWEEERKPTIITGKDISYLILAIKKLAEEKAR